MFSQMVSQDAQALNNLKLPCVTDFRKLTVIEVGKVSGDISLKFSSLKSKASRRFVGYGKSATFILASSLLRAVVIFTLVTDER